MDKLLFGQQNINNFKFFGDNYVNILINETPHYKFLQKNIKIYSNYLKFSWKNKERSIDDKIIEYTKLKENILKNGINEPILTAKRFNEDELIVHGNHRAAIAKFCDIELFKKDVYYLDFFSLKNIRYGLNNGNRPYQSIFYNNKEVIKGRRNDLLDRFNCIDIADIENKIVLDIGCNIGANCILVNKFAKKMIGIDIDVNIINQAIKLAVYFNENIDYRLIDFCKINEKIDTCFLFAVDKHINDNNKIAKFINKKVLSVCYFETHEYSIIPKIIRNCFSKIKKLRNYKERKLFRCEK